MEFPTIFRMILLCIYVYVYNYLESKYYNLYISIVCKLYISYIIMSINHMYVFAQFSRVKKKHQQSADRILISRLTNAAVFFLHRSMVFSSA